MVFDIHILKIFGLCMRNHYAQEHTIIFENLYIFSNLGAFIIGP